jgi:hypothetical protein
MRKRFVVTVLAFLVVVGFGTGRLGGLPLLRAAQDDARKNVSRKEAVEAAVLIHPDRPASCTRAVNEALRTYLYEPISQLDPQTTKPVGALETDIQDLTRLLKALVDLDAPIAVFSRGAGLEDDAILRTAERNRAAAWLHGWAVFSLLIQEASRPGVGLDIRRRLLVDDNADDDRSTFGLLRTSYRQMRETNTRFREVGLGRLARDAALQVDRLKHRQPPVAEGDPELVFAEARKGQIETWLNSAALDGPLQLRLCDDNGLGLLLSYRQPWTPEAAPPGITHDFAIPSAAFLLGAPLDTPSPNSHRQIHTLWSLVNLQLDTWQNWTMDSLGRRSGNGMQLEPLADWIGHLAADLERNGFVAPRHATGRSDGSGQPTAGKPGQTANADDGLVRRLKKIAGFLDFRQRAADEKAFQELLRDLQRARLDAGDQKVDLQTIKSLQPLIEAATLENDGDYLSDAAIWLRYVVLLSYQNQASVVGDGESGNSLAKVWAVWEKRMGPLGLDKPVDKVAHVGDGRPVFLRWGAWPADGHSSAVLNDLTQAAVAGLTFEDTVRNARLATRETLSGLEVVRFKSVTSPDDAVEYQTRLDGLVKILAKEHETHLSPYMGVLGTIDPSTGALTRLPLPLRPRLLSQVAVLALPGPGHDRSDDAGTAEWLASGTPGEQRRWFDDLAVVDARVRSDWLTHSLVLTAYGMRDPRAIVTALASLSGHAGLSGASPYEYPARSFKQYADDLERAAVRLKDFLDNKVKTDDVLDQIVVDKQKLDRSRVELAAAELGQEVARRGIELSGHFREIAELEIQIEAVRGQIAALKNAAADLHVKEAAQRLALQTRLRDLAMARVEALVQASRKAEELAAQASDRLNSMADSLKHTAEKLREEKKRSFLKSIIKGVIGIVGAVLAPFTGGASVGIAAVAISAVDVIDEVARIDWNNPWQDIGELGAAVGQITASLGKVGVKVEGLIPNDLKSALGDAQKFFKSVEGDVKTVGDASKRYSDPVKAVYEAVKKIGPENQAMLTALVSGLGSGIPAKLSADGQLVVDYALQPIEFADGKMKELLRDVLDAGGVIVNDVQKRGDLFSGLPEMDDPSLKKQMSQALNAALRELPDELLDKYRKPGEATIASVTVRYTGARAKLDAYLDGEGLIHQKARQLVAQVLASGMVLVQKGEKEIVAARQKTEDEIKAAQDKAKKFQDRLLNEAKTAYNDAIQKILDGFQKQEKRLTDIAEKEIAQKDDAGLDYLAGNGIKDAIQENAKLLDQLKQEIAAVREKLDDFQTGVDIATLVSQAADLEARAAQLGVQVSELARKKANLRLLCATFEQTLRQTSKKMADKNLEAAVIAVETAQAELDQAYARALALGIDPFKLRTRRLAGRGAIGLGLRDVLDGLAPPAEALRLLESGNPGGLSDLQQQQAAARRLVANLAEPVVGMIQWVNLLRLNSTQPENGTPLAMPALSGQIVPKPKDLSALGLYLDLLDTIRQTKPNSALEGVRGLAASIDKFYLEKVVSAGFEFAKYSNVMGRDLYWFDAPKNSVFDITFLEDLPEGVRLQVIAAVSFRLTRERVPIDARGAGAYKLGDSDAAYYVIHTQGPDSVNVSPQLVNVPPNALTDTAPLFFYLVPPKDPVSRSNVLLGRRILSDGRLIYRAQAQSLIESVWQGMVASKLDLWKSFNLTGAEGEWTFFLIDNRIEDDKDRLESIKQYRDTLQLTLRLPCLKVMSPQSPSGINPP